MKKIAFWFVITACVLNACKSESKANNENEDNMTDSIVPTTNIPADIYPTANGDLSVSLIGHGSLMFEYDGKIIHVDPYSKVADYSKYPQADLIILTHEHPDHLDTAAINKIRTDETRFIVSKVCNQILGYGEIISNGGRADFDGIAIEAVPAYNMINKKPDGEFYHPKGRGNGYVFTFGDKKVYVAGDTENIPEMEKLRGEIEVAFLPKNLPYTMSDEMFIDAAKKVMPNYLYPYHFTEMDETKLTDGLKDTKIKLLIRPMSSK